MKRCVSLFFSVVVAFAAVFAGEPLRVLAIGNSFSVDALEQEMFELVKAADREILIGNLYIGGCSIDRHLKNMKEDLAEYSYRKINIEGRADTIANCKLSYALSDEKWDYITFQQSSPISGQYESFANVPELISLVRTAVGPEPTFLWHMTWAYSPDSKHDGFANYGKDQTAMYNAIVECAQRVLADNPELKGIIPCGTAIQNARTSALGLNLTRDGYHLSRTTGRYIASCTWFAVLFDSPVLGTPDTHRKLNHEQHRVSQTAADAAVRNPFQVTQVR